MDRPKPDVVLEAESRRSEGAVRSSKAHQAILAAALEILEEQGYTGFTIEAVALRARAGKPTIYRWWKSKGALLVEINDQLFAPLFQLPELGSVEKELAAYLTTLWRILRVHPNSIRGAFSAAQHDADTAKLLRDQMLVRRRTFVHGIMARGIARGELADSFDVDTAVDVFLGFNVFRLLIDEAIGEREARNFVSILLGGLRREPSVAARACR